MRFLLLIPIVLLAGYVIARNHHRLRTLGIGIMSGTALPPLPDSDDDGHGHGDHHGHHNHHDHHGHLGHHDYHDGVDSSHVDSSHVDTGHHGY